MMFFKLMTVTKIITILKTNFVSIHQILFEHFNVNSEKLIFNVFSVMFFSAFLISSDLSLKILSDEMFFLMIIKS